MWTLMALFEFQGSGDCDLCRLEEGPDALDESDENLRMAGGILCQKWACKE
jgi:hypothetical protein